MGRCDHCGDKNYIYCLNSSYFLTTEWKNYLTKEFLLNVSIAYGLAWNPDSNSVHLNSTLESSISLEQFTFKH